MTLAHKNFISAYADKRRGKVIVWESIAFPGKPRQRVRKEYDNPYYFYVEDRLGDYKAMTGELLKKITNTNEQAHEHEMLAYSRRWESDIEPLERVLQDNYATLAAPQLNIGFLDIEVDYDPAIGYSRPTDPYAPINAISLMKYPSKELITLAVPPSSWRDLPLDDMLAALNIPGLRLFSKESEMLEAFIEELHDIDIVSGWNSEFFDMPYIGKRVELILGEQAFARLGFEGGPVPRWTEKARFKNAKKKDLVLDLISRPHLDYMQLFKKFNLKTRQSFSLNNVAADELGEKKLEYDGSLAELYNDDFGKFIMYNQHDARLLMMFEEHPKIRYIELANQMVHESTVNFHNIFGSVAVIDNAVINFLHHKLNMIAIDRKVRPEEPPVEGAIVMTPKPGFYKWIAACDINSLYPSTIRSLNLSPEKIVGQLVNHEADWRLFYEGRKGIQKALDTQVTMRLADGAEIELLISELIDLCNAKALAVSAFGTVLDQTEQGVLPAVLTYWFTGRKEMQAKKKTAAKAADAYLAAGGSSEDVEYKQLMSEVAEYEMKQGVRKVLLNSLYGALLNAFMRFGDSRLGASTTFSGRQITTNMINTATACLTDKPGRELVKQIIETPIKKRAGHIEIKVSNEYTLELDKDEPGAIYGDTDSVYFTMRGLVDNKADAIATADVVAAAINDSWPEFMKLAFNCQPGYENLIKANREIVARSGLLQAKKKYFLALIDKEGDAIEEGSDDELKTMGSDIKLSSTPEVIRQLLTVVVMGVLNEVPKKVIDEHVMNFRDRLASELTSTKPLDLAAVVSVKELDNYQLLWERTEKQGKAKVTMPANARSTINYNYALERFNQTDEDPIISGDKIKILWLMPNQDGLTSMAFPSELENLPKWFTDRFEVDRQSMEKKLVDQKLKNIFDALGWEVPTFQSKLVESLLEF